MRNRCQQDVIIFHTLQFASWNQLRVGRVLRVEFYAKKVGKPLYIRTSLKMVGGAGFEPTKSKTTDLQSAPFDRFGIPPITVINVATKAY